MGVTGARSGDGPGCCKRSCLLTNVGSIDDSCSSGTVQEGCDRGKPMTTLWNGQGDLMSSAIGKVDAVQFHVRRALSLVKVIGGGDDVVGNGKPNGVRDEAC